MLTVDISLPEVEELQKLVEHGQEKGFLTYDEIVAGRAARPCGGLAVRRSGPDSNPGHSCWHRLIGVCKIAVKR